jgi:type I restriction enzyme S subunit
MYALICSRTRLREWATGATHKTIYMPLLESFHLCAPAVDEQRTIAQQVRAQLDEVEAARAAAQAQLSDIEALPGKLLKQAYRS